MSKAKKIPSARAKRLWQRLGEWYGTRLLEQYGAEPPPDWCEIVDRCDNEKVKKGLSVIRRYFLKHPPTLPEFDLAMRPPHLEGPAGPNTAERLCTFIMRNYRVKITERQIREPWIYFGNPQAGITGVDVPADGDSTSLRVKVEDMGIEQVT